MRKAQILALSTATMMAFSNAVLAMSVTRLPIAIALFDAVVCGGVVACLWIVTLPLAFRLIPTLAIITSFLVMTYHADLFSIEPSKERIDKDVLADDPSLLRKVNGTSSSGTQSPPESAIELQVVGATVHLRAGKNGTDWAQRLNARLNRQVGGKEAANISINGVVSADGPQAATTVSVIWTVALHGQTMDCGRSSVIGSDDAILLDQIEHPLRTAIQRTAETKELTCY